jgi:hypothetical protein
MDEMKEDSNSSSLVSAMSAASARLNQVCGSPVVIVPAKPLSPSTTAIRMSLTPLVSLTTFSQNFSDWRTGGWRRRDTRLCPG